MLSLINVRKRRLDSQIGLDRWSALACPSLSESASEVVEMQIFIIIQKLPPRSGEKKQRKRKAATAV